MRMRVEDKVHQIHATAPTWVGHGGDPARLEAILRDFERMMKLAMSEWDIYYKRSTDGGLTWTADRRLTDAPRLSQRPSIAMSEDELHVVWFDGRDDNAEIYYKHSSDAGMTWEEDMRLTDAPGESLHASVAVSSEGDVHLVWFDHRDGNPEIYYKRSMEQVRR